MQRVLITIAALAFVFIAIIAISAGVVFNTDGGRRFLAGQAEKRIGDALSGQATIGVLEGDLPGEVIVRNVTLKDEDGVWLMIDRAEMTWSPLALLRRSAEIERITVDGLTFLRPPKSSGPNDAPEAPEGFEFPERLPKISVDAFSLTNANIRNPDTGELISLNSDGALAIGGKKVDAQLTAASGDGADRLTAAINFDPAETNAAVDISLTSAADGLLATMAALDGPLSISATGNAPPEDFTLTLNGVLGAYGEVASALEFDMDDQRSVTITGGARFGERLDELRTAVGPEIAFETSLRESDAGAQVTIRKLATEAINVSGDAVWRNRRGRLLSLDATLRAAIAPPYFGAVREQFGPDFAAEIEIERRGEAYRAEAGLSADHAQAAIKDATTDLATFLNGDVSVVLAETMKALSPLSGPLSLTTAAAINQDAGVQLSNLSVDADGERILVGSSDYAFQSETLKADVSLTLPPTLAAAVTPQFTFTDPVEADLTVAGAIDNFAASLTADIPAMAINGSNLTASRLVANLSGLPRRPNGDIKADTIDGIGATRLTLRSSAEGDIRLQNIEHRGEGFALIGDAQINPQQQNATLDLTYKGNAGAAPFPGVKAEGDIRAIGMLGAKDTASDMQIIAERFSTDAVTMTNLKAAAKGPPEAIAVTADIGQLDLAGSAPISTLSAQATVQLAGTPFAAITGLSFDYDDIPVRLTQTATVQLGEAIEVKTLRATIGATGALSLDGAYGADKITGRIDATRLPLPAAAAFVDFNAAIDTDAALRAEGGLAIQSDIAQADIGSIKTAFQWRDDRLYITDTGQDGPLSIDISAPLKLIRTPSLEFDATGEIEGAIAYDGPAQTLAVFLPPTLQSLEGALKTDIKLGGDVESPQIDGVLSLADGAYTELSSGLSLVNISFGAQSVADRTGANITFSGGAAGPGQQAQSITVEGAMALGETNNVDARLSMREAQFSAAPVNSIVASGDVTVSGSIDNLKSAGDIAIEELNAEIITPKSTGLVDIEVVAIDGNGERATAVDTTETNASLTADIAVKADDRIFIRGRGLESEWSADVTAQTGASGALILGRVDLRRGWLDFSGRRFNLTKGEIRFNRLSPNNPFLNMRAEYETGDGVVAAIVVKGRAQSPSIELESTPSLPREDIMALVLFGKPASELSATESLQMAQALAQLGGIGPFGGSGGLTGSARQALGLDLLNIDLDPENGGSALTVGKYVADGLFVSATQDVRGENGSVRVEYEITNNITVETELQQNGDQTVSANWKRDF